jgi:hypothetical protein
MIPAPLNLEVYKGVTFEPVTFTMRDAALNSVDLTDWSVFAEVRKNCSNSLVLDLLPVISDAVNGEITISLTDEVTANLGEGSFYWDLILENDLGERLGPYLAGKFTISCVITQP